MDRRILLRPLLFLSAGALLASAGAQAQQAAQAPDADAGIEEVVVTATKQAESASKVPISISAYTQQMMDDRAIRTISDIVAQTPGLDLGDQGNNGAGNRVSVRGIDSNSGAATTGVYIDDTPLQSRSNPVNLAGTVFPEVFDLERVEVLRGPQGTLFGAGAEGGVVRFITPTPSLEKNSAYARSEASFTQHGDPSIEGGAAFGGPLKEGVLGIRVSGWARHSGGYVDRTSWQTGETHKAADWSEAGGARVALLWQPTDGWQVTPSLLYQGSHTNDSPDYWSYLSSPSSGRFVNGYAAQQPSTEHFTLPGLKIQGDLGALQFTSITSFFYRSEGNVTDVTNYDIAGALGAAGANGEDNIFPTVASGAPVQDLFIGTTHQNIFTQELRLQNTDASARLKWVAGLYYQNSRLNDVQVAPNPQLINLFDEQQGPGAFDSYYYDPSTCVSDCAGLLRGTVEYQGSEYSRDQQIAAFGNVNYRITPRLSLVAGLRVEKTKSTFVAIEDGPVNNGSSIGGGGADATPVTPKLGLSFQKDDDTLYYATLAKGYRPGGGNSHIPPACSLDLSNIGLTTGAPGSYDSDTTLSYELGTKQRALDGHLSIDASAYYIDWRNVQWYYFLPNCGYGITFNLGHVRSTGFDLDLNWKLSPELLAGLAIGYNSAYFDDTVTKGGSPVVFADQTLGQAPLTVFTSLEYRFSGRNDGWYARITDDYKSANDGKYLYQFADSAVYDPDLKPGPSSNQLDLRLGHRLSGLDISAFVSNALDSSPRFVNPQSSHYVGYDFNSGDAVGSPIYAYSTLRPRTIGVTLTWNY